jgi:hypothetical protein
MVISLGDSRYVPPFIIEKFKVIGNHGAILPSVQGGASLVWGRMLNNGVWGVSLMELDKKIDNGTILKTSSFNYELDSDMNSFCDMNEISDVSGFAQLCLRKGYYIEKYGLLNQGQLPDVIDREFEKEVIVEDESKIQELQREIENLKAKLQDQKEIECGKLQETLLELNRQLGDKNRVIKDLTSKVNDLEGLTKSSYAFYLKNSNLKDRLYK